MSRITSECRSTLTFAQVRALPAESVEPSALLALSQPGGRTVSVGASSSDLSRSLGCVLVCADAQIDDGGVVDGEDAGIRKGPAGGVPAGPWCAWWRLGDQSAVTSAAAVRALDSLTMALRAA